MQRILRDLRLLIVYFGTNFLEDSTLCLKLLLRLCLTKDKPIVSAQVVLSEFPFKKACSSKGIDFLYIFSSEGRWCCIDTLDRVYSSEPSGGALTSLSS